MLFFLDNVYNYQDAVLYVHYRSIIILLAISIFRIR